VAGCLPACTNSRVDRTRAPGVGPNTERPVLGLQSDRVQRQVVGDESGGRSAHPGGTPRHFSGRRTAEACPPRSPYKNRTSPPAHSPRLPAPSRSTARTWTSCSQTANVAASARIIAGPRALSASGRLRVSRPSTPSRRTSTWVTAGNPSRPGTKRAITPPPSTVGRGRLLSCALRPQGCSAGTALPVHTAVQVHPDHRGAGRAVCRTACASPAGWRMRSGASRPRSG
jgi:hypothetical protein